MTDGMRHVDIDHLKQWVGRSETRTETITPVPINALNALLDRDEPPSSPGEALPPLWHWLGWPPRKPDTR
jgi:3-methylfumaryl-CoA hydratase